jgi:hypothetical protein
MKTCINMKNIKFDLLEIFINNFNIDILEHGHLYAYNNWKHYGVTSPFNRLYYILDGSACLRNHNESIILKPGNV